MFPICSYNYYYRLVYYLLGDNWLFCRLRAQCMIFNVHLFLVWWCVSHYSLQNSVWRVICLDLRLRLTTVTSTLISPNVKITQSKNCLIFTSRLVSNAYHIINILKNEVSNEVRREKTSYSLQPARSDGLILCSHRAWNVRGSHSEVEAQVGFTYTVNDLINSRGVYLILGIQAGAFNK